MDARFALLIVAMLATYAMAQNRADCGAVSNCNTCQQTIDLVGNQCVWCRDQFTDVDRCLATPTATIRCTADRPACDSGNGGSSGDSGLAPGGIAGIVIAAVVVCCCCACCVALVVIALVAVSVWLSTRSRESSPSA